ncbi:hypothetical protein DL771_000277 [Monosporascus sp. 5C6A]|nr:hypothetical protein DL771_000277 [Monosporascus sp. 5C6A]
MPLQATTAAQTRSLPELHLRRRELLANLAILQHSPANGFSTGAVCASLLGPTFLPAISPTRQPGFAVHSASRLETAEAELEVLHAEVLHRGLVPYEPKTREGLKAFFAPEDKVVVAGQEFSENLVGKAAANTLAQTMHQHTADELSDQGMNRDTETSCKGDGSGGIANNASSNDSPGDVTGAEGSPRCMSVARLQRPPFVRYMPGMLRHSLRHILALLPLRTVRRELRHLHHMPRRVRPLTLRLAAPAPPDSSRGAAPRKTECQDKRDKLHICEDRIRDAHSTVSDVRDLRMHGLPSPWNVWQSSLANPLEDVQFLRIASRNFESGQARCYHAKELDDELLDRLRSDGAPKKENTIGNNWGRRMAKDLRPLLYKIKDGGLRSFSWGMGSCMPWDIMGRCGWLMRHQKDIESLTIVNGSQCPHRDSSNKKPDFTLEPFSRLESFTWISIMAGKGWCEVAASLRGNAPHLRRVELDFVWPGGCERPKVGAIYVHLGVTMGFNKWSCISYPAVRELAFSDGILEDISYLVLAFAWEKITSLSPVQCTGARAGMEALATSASTVALRLKTFELSCEAQDADPSEERVIANFLTSFRGLENLYTRRGDAVRRWRQFLPDPYVEPVETLGLDAEDLRQMAGYNLLTSLGSESLGLAGRPRAWKSILRPLSRTETIKVLHLRQPGPNVASREVQDDDSDDELYDGWSCDMAELLDWVFGDEGIKSVELLAFGDFPCRGRYLDKSFIVRRRQTGANDDKEGNYSPWVLYDRERHGHQKILRLETLLDQSYAFLRLAPTESLPFSY